ncbi:ATP-binding protein [Pseudomonas silvicola]|nr:ATP-binding protein [Pseudomonas silvicola]
MSTSEIHLLQAEIARLTQQLAEAEHRLATDQQPGAQALKASQRRYQRLLDSIDEGFCVIRMRFDESGTPADYQFIETNRAFQSHTGLQDACGNWMRELAPDHEQHWFDIYGEIAKSGKAARFEQRAEALNRWYDVRASAVGNDGELVALLFSDISAQRQAQEALRDSEAYWRGIFENLNDGLVLGELIRDAEGRAVDWRYLDVNRAWGDKVGIDPASTKGKTVRQVFPSVETFWISGPAEAVALGESIAFNHQVGNVSRWYEGRIHPLSGDRFTIILQDVTEFYISTARRSALLELGDRLRELSTDAAMANAATTAVVRALNVEGAYYLALDDRGGASRVAASGTELLEPALIAMLPCTQWFAVDDLGRDPRTQAWKGDTPLAVMNTPILESGRAIASLLIFTRAEHTWSQPESRFARDILERTNSAVARKQAEEELRNLNASLEQTVLHRTEALLHSEAQLRQAQKMEAVGQLTGGIAHDFNNLLTGISGSLEMMQNRIAQGRITELDKYLSAAQGAARRAASLTHRLLAFSRRQTLDPKATHVGRLVEGMKELIARTVGPSIETQTRAGNEVWPVYVDANQLENALLNLCINARDAMPDGGRLTVETDTCTLDARCAAALDLPQGDYVSLSVCDTGTGMPPDVAAKAFEPFYTTKPIGMGTGLGLSMIYGFIRQSGGQVKIDSQAGQGSTVSLYLPRHRGESAAVEPSRVSTMPKAGEGETVLVVDDEPSVRVLVMEILEELGYHALEAADGPSGLRVLESSARIDLLVSDVGLPGNMNGRQMADAGRVIRPQLKVLFITGYAEQAVIGSGDLDANMHIMTKPFSVEGLAVRIKSLMHAC